MYLINDSARHRLAELPIAALDAGSASFSVPWLNHNAKGRNDPDDTAKEATTMSHSRQRLLKKIAVRRKKTSIPSETALLIVDPLPRAQHMLADGCSLLVLGKRILTPREVEVLRLVARGETDRSIADRLYLSRRTVSSHVSNILSKLEVPSRREAVRRAARIGLL